MHAARYFIFESFMFPSRKRFLLWKKKKNFISKWKCENSKNEMKMKQKKKQSIHIEPNWLQVLENKLF